jgi:hypothetical protein
LHLGSLLQTDLFRSLTAVTANLIEGKGEVSPLISRTDRDEGQPVVSDPNDLAYPFRCWHTSPLFIFDAIFPSKSIEISHL